MNRLERLADHMASGGWGSQGWYDRSPWHTRFALWIVCLALSAALVLLATWVVVP